MGWFDKKDPWDLSPFDVAPDTGPLVTATQVREAEIRAMQEAVRDIHYSPKPCAISNVQEAMNHGLALTLDRESAVIAVNAILVAHIHSWIQKGSKIEVPDTWLNEFLDIVEAKGLTVNTHTRMEWEYSKDFLTDTMGVVCRWQDGDKDPVSFRLPDNLASQLALLIKAGEYS